MSLHQQTRTQERSVSTRLLHLFLLPSTSSPSPEPPNSFHLSLNVDSEQDAQADPLRILPSCPWAGCSRVGDPHPMPASPPPRLFHVASIYPVQVFLSVYPTSRSLSNPGKGVGLCNQTLSCGVRLSYSGILSPAVISVWSWIFRFHTYKTEYTL